MTIFVPLWLPYLTAPYVRVTGGTSILDGPLPYLFAPELAPGQDEAYLRPASSGETADLYDHCTPAPSIAH